MALLEATPVHCLSPLTTRNVLCVGPWYLQHQRNWSTKQDGKNFEGSGDGLQDGDSEELKFDTDDVEFLRSLDPKEWKNQDHYAVLGLSKIRHRATDEDIKRAYRDKVRRHHPDKRRARGEEILPDDDYFTCITKAWEMLGTPKNRRAYDSVDPLFDNSIPAGNDHAKKYFFETFAPVFRRNARWSIKTPVPQLGTCDSQREDVEQFYSFWYNFQSWREYSYLDEEEKEKGQGREERRWIERQNKAARDKLKKEEMTRIRQLVDMAYALDPRIQRFKQEDKDKKQAAKQAKKDAAKARKEEEERKVREEEEEARRKKEEEEAEEQAKRNALKAEREAAKKELKQKRAQLRRIVKAKNYFTRADEELVPHMAGLEKICETLNAEELQRVAERLERDGRNGYVAVMQELDRRIEEEKKAFIDNVKRNYAAALSPEQRVSSGGKSQWSHEELQLLIKAVNIFPPGTNRRWEVVASFINQHRPENAAGVSSRTPKDVLSKAKDLQNSDFTSNALKVSANQNAFNNCCEKTAPTVPDAAVSSDSGRKSPPAVQESKAQDDKKDIPWTAQEQQLLEQALRTYPASTCERWDKISECIPSRNKKECMRRYKELVELVKSKKAAQAAVPTTCGATTKK